ncbi:cold shock domain-containing protein [Dictyobacter kobayashii]|uniref:Cold-shock protein n=1 Tax=Dictyobacter kobayashii TaxID=2014872 RepID=A0A402AXB6_9CHLR|nr:cold shock domain-containing protein [Dictyobacter kobayashii]GCE23771.1 hypothetical protein KDK_75710 [Dictyobacter kobayashii]
MTTFLKVNDQFPDIALPDQQNRMTHLSHLTRSSLLDQHLGFSDGYPLILIFLRGYFCPRDQQQMRQMVEFQSELAVNYARLATISVDPPSVNDAFRAGLNARWPFLSDESRSVVKQINILDETEGEYAYRAQPYTFVLRQTLQIQAIYNGWFFVGRPTLEELRQNLRTIMQERADYRYEAYNDPAVRQVRIPQQEWEYGTPSPGASGLPVATGSIRWFDKDTGVGMIAPDNAEPDIFFHFTAIPGRGYRTIRPGVAVRFEIVTGQHGLSARNIQQIE